MLIVKTDLGHQVIKDRSVPLTPRQRSALIMVDGHRTVDQLLQSAGGVTREDIDKLLELALVVDARPEQTRAEEAAARARAEAVEHHKHRTPQERYAEAYPIATALTAGLGLRGFRLNLAVEAATTYEQLLEIAPKIREAVGPDKFRPLDNALNDR
jgi:superfamily II DNA or RNA helicase